MKRDWLWLIGCGVIGAVFVCYAYFKLMLLIEIWRTVCR